MRKNTPKRESPKEVYRDYREKLMNDKVSYEKYKEKDRARKKIYRQEFTGERKAHYNEMAKLRMRKMRSRKRQNGEANVPVCTRKQREKQREYRRTKRESKGQK